MLKRNEQFEDSEAVLIQPEGQMSGASGAVEEAAVIAPKGHPRSVSSTANFIGADAPKRRRAPRSKEANTDAPSGHHVAAPLLLNSGATVSLPVEGRVPGASDEEGALGQMSDKDQAARASSSPIIDELREQWRRRQAWHRAEKSLTLTAKAICRRLCKGDKVAALVLYKAAISHENTEEAREAYVCIVPIIMAREQVESAREKIEERIELLATQLPVTKWWTEIRGCGLLGLAGVVGECGDLSNYSTHSKLWKRLGLAVMPDGTRQRRVTGDAAKDHGFSPARRSVVWTIGDSLFKAQSERAAREATATTKARAFMPAGPYRVIYDRRKEYELARLPVDEKGRLGHAHDRAKRYMEKRLIRQLWKAWRKVK
jgi:hypothetical protein